VAPVGTEILLFPGSVLRLLLNANVVSSTPILVSLLMEVTHSSETSILTTATLCNVPEDDILHTLYDLDFLNVTRTYVKSCIMMRP
jgi:hypothetical protein